MGYLKYGKLLCVLIGQRCELQGRQRSPDDLLNLVGVSFPEKYLCMWLYCVLCWSRKMRQIMLRSLLLVYMRFELFAKTKEYEWKKKKITNITLKLDCVIRKSESYWHILCAWKNKHPWIRWVLIVFYFLFLTGKEQLHNSIRQFNS